MREKLKSRGVDIALGVAILVLLVVLAVILLDVFKITASESFLGRNKQVWVAKDAQMTLAEALQQADVRARAWADDALFIRAAAAWRPGETWMQAGEPPVTWSFYYFAQSKRSLKSFVIGGEQVLEVPPIEISYIPKVIPALPSYEVDVAWLSFRAGGGDDFLRAHPQAMVDFRLQPKDDIVVWRVSAFEGKDYLEVLMDAESGAVLLQ